MLNNFLTCFSNFKLIRASSRYNVRKEYHRMTAENSQLFKILHGNGVYIIDSYQIELKTNAKK